MADDEKIRAMEEGHSIITSQSPPIDQQRENTEPASPSSRSWFSFGSSKPLVSSSVNQSPSDQGKFMALLKKKWRSQSCVPATKPKVVVRPVHGGVDGYPKMAAFLDSDDNFMVYRRFGYVQSRLLLARQEKLRRLEARLEKLDKQQVTESNDLELLCKAKLGGDMEVVRETLMSEMEKEYLEYTNLLQTAHAMVALNKPSASEWTSVANFIHNEKPLVKDQRSFILRKEDLVTLRPGREYAWLDSFIEKMLRWCKSPFLDRVFCSEETRKKSDQKNEVYYTRTRIDKAVNVIITFMILVLLILPIWPLYRLTQGTPTVHTSAICIGVLLVFTLAFSAVITLFTRARRHEILATSAAYCAVLVVFISNVGTQHSGAFGSSN